MRPIPPTEVRGFRRVLMPVLGLLGLMIVLTSVSWFSQMEVSAPHIQVRHRIGVAAGARGGSRGAAGGGSALADTPSPTVPTAAPARACVVSKIVPALSDCLLRPLAQHNVVINSVADKKYSLYAINYVLALRAAGVSNYIMGSLDAELLHTFKGMGAPYFSLANITAGSAWHATNRHKIRVVLAFIEVGVGVLFTDIDVMFVADPMPFLNKWPDADQLISSDMQRVRGGAPARPAAEPRPQRAPPPRHAPNRASAARARAPPVHRRGGQVPARSGSGELEDVGQFKIQHASPLNVGIMLVRPSGANLAFIRDWLVRAEREMHVSMQAIYDILLRTNHTCSVDYRTELATCYKPALKVGLLPVDRFLNGYTYFINHLPEERKVAPIAIHGTFQVHQATVAKIHRFREAQLFFDAPAYYAAGRKYITYTPRLPDWLAPGGERIGGGARKQLPFHFEGVHRQLGQLRWALGLAIALNRTLVLPRFTCLLDNSWYPMMGAWPGFRFTGPFHCPADHVLNFERMQSNLGQARYREHSFLENVRTPAASKAAPRVVLLEGSSAVPRGHPSLPPPTLPPVRIPPNATSEQARRLLGALPDAVLHFEDLVHGFSAFTDRAEQAKFETAVKAIPTLWCCVDGGVAAGLQQTFPPGHIYYDPFWDRPHLDRFGRRQGVPWEMLLGERDTRRAAAS